MAKNYIFRLILLGGIFIVLSYILLRSTLTGIGDFNGYTIVGNLVLDGVNIYKSTLNTWPPFFSIVSVPISLINNFSPYLAKFIWLLGSILAMYKIIDITTQLTLNRKVIFPQIKSESLISRKYISLASWIVLVPLIIVLRQIWGDLGNIQINIYMLLFAMLSLYFYSKNKNILAGLLLAFSISIKVYTIFLFLYFIVKRETKMIAATLSFFLLFAIIQFFIFGFEQTIDYYSFWFNSNVESFASINHKNQSFFSMMQSLLSHESPGLAGPLNEPIFINIMNIAIDQIKIVSYTLIGIAALPVIYLFREKIKNRSSLKAFLEYTLILTLIPILSPLAWKAYFIFLFPGFFINYLFIYHINNHLGKNINLLVKVFFITSIILTVFSSEMFVGKYLADILEVFSCYTIGTLLLGINIVIFYVNYNKYEITRSSLNV